jgi:hypothetical protein
LKKKGKGLHDKVKPPSTHPIEFLLLLSSSLCNCASFTNIVVMQEPLLPENCQNCSQECSKQAEIEETLCNYKRQCWGLGGQSTGRQEVWRQTSYFLHQKSEEGLCWVRLQLRVDLYDESRADS